MSHDATKVYFGTTYNTAKDIEDFNSDPASFPAGCVVRKSTTGLSLLKSAGMDAGISLGKSLSDTKKTSVVRAGLDVPIRLAVKRARATITVTSYANLVSGTDDVITINGTAFTAQAGAATPGDATFQAATSNDATAASLAAQINAHATIGLLVRATVASAVVTIAAVAAGVAGNAITLTYTDNDSNIGATVSGATLAGGSATDVAFAVVGQKVYIDDTSGLATDGTLGGASITDAVYKTVGLTGVNEDLTTTPAALIDMQGGL